MRRSQDFDIRINVLAALEAMLMMNPTGESENEPLRLDFDHRLKLDFHGSRVTSDTRPFAYRDLEDALVLTGMVGGQSGGEKERLLFATMSVGAGHQRLPGRGGAGQPPRPPDQPRLRQSVAGRRGGRLAAATSAP